MQVLGFRGPLFRKFPSYGEAEHFVIVNGGEMPGNDHLNENSSDSDNSSYNDSDNNSSYDDDDDDNATSSSSNKSKNVENIKDVIYSGSTKNPKDRIKALQKYIEELSERNKKLTADIATTSGSMKKRLSDGSSLLGDESSPAKCKKPNDEELSPSKGQMKKYGKYWFVEDADGYVQVYTDGSCENNGRPNAIAGLGVFFNDGHAL